MKLRTLWAAALLFFAPIAVTGCAAFNQAAGVDLVVPISEDYSIEQNAYAAMRAYAETSVIVADLLEDKATPDGVKTILATALLNTEGQARALNAGWKAYAKLKADIDVRTASGQPVSEALLTEAASAYFTAKELWREHGDTVTTFPGIVKAVRTAGQPLPEAE